MKGTLIDTFIVLLPLLVLLLTGKFFCPSAQASNTEKNNKSFISISIILLTTTMLLFGCGSRNSSGKHQTEIPETDSTMYSNPLLEAGAEPWVTYHNGNYYYTQGSESEITLWKTKDLSKLSSAEHKIIYTPVQQTAKYHLWAPELHYIDNKWYLYYTADDGNTDNHQIYVAENPSANPLEGQFQYKAHISTDTGNSWAIHPNVFSIGRKQYMIWSGWQQRRTEAETQCIYIAEMRNAWSLSSERVLISRPEYEWERQWVNPDGNKSAYPIYVNENPQSFISHDKVIIYYCASGSWTPYYCVGKLEADIKSNLLNPKSWKKSREPIFMQNARDSIFSTGGLCFVQSRDKSRWYMLYHARKIPNDAPGAIDSRSPRMQPIGLTSSGEPILGKPVPTDSLLQKP